jgi:nitrous oxidase accessory protein
MKKITNIALLSMFFLAIIFTFQSIYSCNPNSTLLVDISGNADYTTITDAINDAEPGDTIYVYSGTYSENLVIDKSIILTGQNKQNTIITGSTTGHTITVTADNVQISGFTIKDPIGNDMKCLYLNRVTGCTISLNLIKNGDDGIYMISSHNNIISENIIEEHESNGIYAYLCNNNEIYENILRNNNGRGIYLLSSNNNIVYLNDFSSNTLANAYDNADNNWYNGNQGNYWDDYNDYDSNNDGIGDNPYTKGGVNDQKPLGYFIYPDPTARITSITPNPAVEGQTISFSGYGTPSYRIQSYQ